ncbi:MAG: GGDEF domain-containing protein [Treponema sp.]|nr:GGDEF domain-containing protein [Treponema sp.]
MKKKFYINSNIERLFSLFGTLVIILVLNIILANTLLKKIQHDAKATFIEQCVDTVEDYSLALQTKLRTLESEIDITYAKLAYKTLSPEVIQELLLREKANLSINFNEIIYSDIKGDTYNFYGEEHNIADREYFKNIMSGKTDFYVSKVLESKHNGEPIIVFARPLYDETNRITGVLCAGCTIETIGSFIDEIKIGTDKKMSVRDTDGKFIKHYNPSWTNWSFHSGVKKPTDFIETEKIDTVMRTTDVEGNDVYLFYKELENAPWIIGLTIPFDEFAKIDKKQEDYQDFILEVIIIALALIFLLEIWLHSVLERHQILSTHIDSVTHLWVRAYFEKEANKMLKRYSNSKFIMIESDIRGFKFINQNQGEGKANQILLQFSKILYETTKSFDGILSRGYADHFYIFIKITSVHKAMHFFKESLARITEEIKELEFPFTPKFGISFFIPKKMDSSITAQTLISRAHFAKGSIKENALQQFAIYDEKLLQHSSEENYIETHMENALENEEFFLMYQPKIDLLTDKVVGAEALVRWQSPELGFMPPNSFIPLFERNNFVVKLDFYVYEQVFKFLRKCMDEGEPVVPVSVNMSRNHDKPERFVHDFTALLKKYDVPPALVEVELLERSSMDKNILREVTLMLQKEGFKVAMDDFGSGESSLNMLSTIPVNVLKFDRSFLFASDAKEGKLDETSENFIETLVDLGKNLKKETIFEGVETQEQRDFLRKIKCDQVQGYFYSKPLREEEFMEFLKKHR